MSLALLLVTAVVLFLYGDNRPPSLIVPPRLAAALCLSNVALIVISGIVSRILPAMPDTNRKIHIRGSRFSKAQAAATSNQQLATSS